MGDQSYRCAAWSSACVDGSLEKRQGHGVAVQFGTDAQWHRDIKATNIQGSPTPEKVATLAEQVAAGKLQVPIQRIFRLADAEAAIAAFSAGTRGKLVLFV